jgi:hypothetical protein
VCSLSFKLRFLEVSETNDHAIAAMASASNLLTCIVRADDVDVTNEGFKSLIEAGGGQVLRAVTVSVVKSRPL